MRKADTATHYAHSLYSRSQSTVISSVTPASLRNVITGPDWTDDGELAIAAVQMQLATFADEQSSAAKRSQDIDGSLFDAVASKIAQSLGDDPEEDIKAIMSLPQAVARRAIWKWEKLPYSALCAARGAMSDENDGEVSKRARRDSDAISSDVDEWYVPSTKLIISCI